MPNYTHEVFQPHSKGRRTTHYYHQPSKRVFDLKGEMVNPDWEPDGKWWGIREINIDLENK